MPDKTPAQLADDAYEAVRALNHATLSERDGWRYLGDAYSTVANLSALAGGLPQALDQIGALVERLALAGNLRSDKDTLDTDLENTYGGLAVAHDAARQLYEALDRAHQALGPIAYQD